MELKYKKELTEYYNKLSQSYLYGIEIEALLAQFLVPQLVSIVPLWN